MVDPDAGFQLDHILSALPVAVYVCDADGSLRFWNRHAVELWGREPSPGDPQERFCGSHRLLDLEGRPMPHEACPMADVLRTGEALRGEVQIERPDASRLTACVHITPLRRANGTLAGALNVFQDITEQRRTHEDLRLSEARYRAIVEDQPDLVCRFRADGVLTFANESYCRYFGLDRSRIVGSPYRPIVHPDDLEHVQARVAALSPEHPVDFIENRVIRADGAVRWTEWTNRGLFDRDGRLVEFQSAGRDVTERKRAEEDAARLAAIVTSADIVIYAMTLDGVITSWNAAAERVFGYAADEVIGRPVTLLQPPGKVNEGRSIRTRVQEGHMLSLETERMARDGRAVPVSLIASPIRDGRGGITGISILARDVTAERQAQAAIELHLRRERAARAEADAARREAERASQAKDEFLAMLAHELRNPLGVIAAATSVIEGASPGDARYERARTAIRRQTEHLSRLLDDLLDVARITRGQIELHASHLDLRTVVELAAESHRHRFDAKRQALEVAVPPAPVVVSGDSVRLQQVLGNLLHNASKHSNPGGTIAVSLEADGDRAVIRVRDDGTGIEPDRLEWIFELFTQANPSFARTEGGLGIGLTVARRLVELHGGRIRAVSEGVNRGAEFVLEIPVARAAATAAPTAPSAAPAAGRRVLVIEDHDDGREMLVTALRLFGHEVYEAATGHDGIAQAARHSPDIVVVDIGLPDIQGYEVARALRKNGGSSARIVALTGYGLPADRERSADAGFDAHLLKPIDPVRLVAALEDLS